MLTYHKKIGITGSLYGEVMIPVLLHIEVSLASDWLTLELLANQKSSYEISVQWQGV